MLIKAIEDTKEILKTQKEIDSIKLLLKIEQAKQLELVKSISSELPKFIDSTNGNDYLIKLDKFLAKKVDSTGLSSNGYEFREESDNVIRYYKYFNNEKVYISEYYSSIICRM
jgi:hypothetical protein